MTRRILNLLISLDQFLFCLVTFGSSDPDETLSAAAWRWELYSHRMGFMRPLIDWLFFFDKNHCQTSYENERLRKQLPDQYQTTEV